MNSPYPKPLLFTFIHTRTDRIFYIPLSEIPYYDVTFCMEGRMEYEFNGEEIVLESGDAFIFPPGSKRIRRETSVSSYYTCFNVMPRAEDSIDISGVFRKCIDHDTVYMIEIIDRLMKSASPFKIEKSYDLFMFLFHQLAEKIYDTDSDYVRSVKQYIEEHIADNITISDISAGLHLTPNYLCNLFKKETGGTVFGYMLKRRVELAKMLIVTGYYSLSAVSEMCGFKDYNYFSHTFKKIEGVTPSAYKKQILNQ